MLLTVFCLRRDRSELTFSLQVDADFELQNFRALCELESGIPAAESQIVYAERPLTDNHRSLASYGLKDGDVVILQQVDSVEVRPPAQFPGLPRIDFSSITVPGTSAQLPQPLPPQQQPPAVQGSRPSPPDLPSSPQGLDNPALLRDMLLANPHELSLLKERNPPLAEALLSGDLEKFTRVLVEQQQDRARREQERIRLFSADPFDLEAQAKIEEDIRQQNIEENMTIAMEEAPESFGQVVMLYINCKVNGHPVKAFVDSGAQMTIMSQACAERCNIMRLVDRRWAGIAKGVGTQKIIGRVHLAQVQIEGDFLPCSFSILEEQPMDMLLGLDMLKRHQCSLDLKKNVLVIGTTGSQTAFLPEGELPECARLAYGAGREDVRPEEIADQELAEAIQKSVEEAENSDKATTSLERPSLPTSGRFTRPVSFPEIGLRTSRPASRLLGRSASAPSVCSHTGSQAETVNHRATRSEESLLECPKALLREGPPLSPLNISDHAACATVDASLAEEPGAKAFPSPRLPSQNTPDKPVPSGSRKESNAEDDTLGWESPVEVAGGSALSGTWRPAEDPGAGFPSKHLEPNQRSEHCLGLKTHNESAKDRLPDDQSSEPTDREHLCTMKVSPLPAKGEQSFAFSAEGGSAREGERGWPSAEGRRSGSAPCTCPRSETFMEVEVAEETLVAGHLLGQQEAGLPGASLRGSPMEVGSSQQDSSWSLDCLPGGDLMQPGSTMFGVTNNSAMASLSTSSSEGQLSSLPEEPCPSLTSALKELHWLLVESCGGDSWEENGHQPAGVPAEEAASRAAVEEEPECPEVERPFPDPGDGEASTGMCLCEAPVDSLGVQGVRHRLATRSWQEALVMEEPSDLNSPVVQSPSAAPSQLRGRELPEILPPRLSSSQDPGHKVLGQNQSLSSGLPQAEDASWSTCSSSLAGPGMPGVQGSPAESSQPPPVGSPAVGSAALQPQVFPAADIDRIAGSGFTPQEAGEALARAGGNADLALLILLAKNIVVPI